MEEAMTIDAAVMKRFSRYSVEEMIRRQAKKGAAALTSAQVLKLLVPDSANIVNQFKQDC